MEAMATSSKSKSPASVAHGSADPHFPHLGTPDALAGTRFLVPHSGQRAMSVRWPTIKAPGSVVLRSAPVAPVHLTIRRGRPSGPLNNPRQMKNGGAWKVMNKCFAPTAGEMPEE